MGKDATEGNLIQKLRNMERRISALERQQQDVGQLSELASDIGLQTAGEFRSGNGAEPGDGFTGGRFGYPGFVYDGVQYFFVGVNNDVLMVGIDLATGKLTFGGGAGTLDNDGMRFINGTNDNNKIIWKNPDGNQVFTISSNDITTQTVAVLNASAPLTGTVVNGSLIISAVGQGQSDATAPVINLWSPASGAQQIKINSISADVDTIINGTGGAVLTVNAGDNTVDLGDVGVVRGGYQAINDDTAINFTPAAEIGVIKFYGLGSGTQLFGEVIFNTGVPTMAAMLVGTDIAVTTGALTGTTGTDGKFTISCHTDGKIYMENRLGGVRYVRWNLFGGV